jgi:hypothetical protein
LYSKNFLSRFPELKWFHYFSFDFKW